MLAKLEKSSYDYKFLIQDCIPGDDTYMRVLTCYCDQNHKVRFASLGRTLLEDHTPTAIGNPCCHSQRGESRNSGRRNKVP